MECHGNLHKNSGQRPPKRVLFVYDSLRIGGCERVISVLAKEFVKRGISVTILMIKKNKIEFELPASVRVLSFEDFPKCSPLTRERLAMECAFRWSQLAESIMKAFGIERESYSKVKEARKEMLCLYKRYCGFMRMCFCQHPDDVLISFMDNPNFATILAARGLPNRIVISERNHPARDNVQVHILRYRNKLYARADACVFQTAEERDYYPAEIRKKGVLIENPIAMQLPEPYFGCRTREIVTFCRLDRQKNLIGLIDSFYRIKDRYPDCNLVIYGKGNQEQIIREHISDRQLERRVFMRPYDENVHVLVIDAAMFVSFSDYEGISNSMLEAMAIGLPTICTDCPAGGARLMIQNGINGLLVPVGDEAAMAKAMSYLLDHPNTAAEMGKKAAGIRTRCDTAKIADRWERVLFYGKNEDCKRDCQRV